MDEFYIGIFVLIVLCLLHFSKYYLNSTLSKINIVISLFGGIFEELFFVYLNDLKRIFSLFYANFGCQFEDFVILCEFKFLRVFLTVFSPLLCSPIQKL